MPTRSRAMRGHRYNFDRISLIEPKRKKLIEHARLDGEGVSEERRSAFIEATEDALTDAASFRNSVERGPNSSEQAVVLGEVAKHADALGRALYDLDPHSWMELSDALVSDEPSDGAWTVLRDQDDDKPNSSELRALSRAADALRAERLKLRERGRRREQARAEAISTLAWVFHRHAAGDALGSDYEGCLLDFLDDALDAADFDAPVPEKLKQKIPEEYRTPRPRRAKR